MCNKIPENNVHSRHSPLMFLFFLTRRLCLQYLSYHFASRRVRFLARNLGRWRRHVGHGVWSDRNESTRLSNYRHTRYGGSGLGNAQGDSEFLCRRSCAQTTLIIIYFLKSCWCDKQTRNCVCDETTVVAALCNDIYTYSIVEPNGAFIIWLDMTWRWWNRAHSCIQPLPFS